MPSATLLLREPSTISLTSIVEKSQRRKPPFAEYDLRLTANQLDFVLLSATDEGFESDIDTSSIVSSDDSFATGKLQETDSANGSASSSSDSDTDTIAKPSPMLNQTNESYNLVNCVCYTDNKFPNLLLFVTKRDALVFRFDNLPTLRTFYTNFTTFKAIANQNKTLPPVTAKFNLLKRTDSDGITHIEVTKNLAAVSHPRPIPKLKVWKSAEDLLDDAPKRPERRRKKQKAPDPPPQHDVLIGQYVRVNVTHKAEFRYVEVKTPPPETWTYSVPRFLRKPRSQSETRLMGGKNTVADRLFGMSSKLKDFTSGTIAHRYNWDQMHGTGGSLKSVIKKDDNKRKNDKKVTFSAYATVQVV